MAWSGRSHLDSQSPCACHFALLEGDFRKESRDHPGRQALIPLCSSASRLSNERLCPQEPADGENSSETKRMVVVLQSVSSQASTQLHCLGLCLRSTGPLTRERDFTQDTARWASEETKKSWKKQELTFFSLGGESSYLHTPATLGAAP